jgi:hypothetical protein
MSVSRNVLLVAAASVGLASCTDKSTSISYGGTPVDFGNGNTDNGGGGSGGEGEGEGEGEGSASYESIDGYLEAYLEFEWCSLRWYVVGSGASCAGCDFGFAVQMENGGGSCGGAPERSGELVVDNGAMYFDSSYVGYVDLYGDSMSVRSDGYIDGFYGYGTYYSGWFYLH